jgi:ssDNA-binding Zn-finger/Zn-ribbon topoisomerase 1
MKATTYIYVICPECGRSMVFVPFDRLVSFYLRSHKKGFSKVWCSNRECSKYLKLFRIVGYPVIEIVEEIEGQ